MTRRETEQSFLGIGAKPSSLTYQPAVFFSSLVIIDPYLFDQLSRARW
jgi:hypothetical protein